MLQASCAVVRPLETKGSQRGFNLLLPGCYKVELTGCDLAPPVEFPGGATDEDRSRYALRIQAPPGLGKQLKTPAKDRAERIQ